MIRVHHGECETVMDTLEAESCDSWVTDPPSGIEFMDQDWDTDKGGRDKWIEWMAEVARKALRVLKPGAYGAVWAIPRTAHWMAMALENAGFEVRDRFSHYYASDAMQVFLASLSDEQKTLLKFALGSESEIGHIFGQGMPKGILDVSKHLDKLAGVKRTVVGKQKLTGTAKPTAGGSASMFKTTAAIDGYDRVDEATIDVTRAVSELGKRFEFYSTGIKPATEVWFIVRKPMTLTVAKNLAKYGTGAMNTHACKVARPEGVTINRQVNGAFPFGDAEGEPYETVKSDGSWPANVVLSHGRRCSAEGCQEGCPVALMDEQGGERVSGSRAAGVRKGIGYHGGKGDGGPEVQGSTGGASRFFNVFWPDSDPFIYTPKAAKSEKNEGLSSQKKKKTNDGRSTPIDNPFQRGETERHNNHPTVKSVALMRFFCRLVTPKGGKILESFGGSGTTAVAGDIEEFDVEVIEKNAEFVELINARVAHARRQGKLFESVGGAK